MNTPFIPIQGKRDTIQAQKLTEGNLYFATDTGEIFLDTASERIPVGGGGVSVLYANASGVSQDLTDLSYVIYFDDLDDKDAVPKKDDLIINYANGAFYKVRSYSKATGVIKCSRIAVSGTGGGGGGGNTGDGSTPGESKYVDLVCSGTAPNAQTYIYGQSQNVYFDVSATHDAIIIVNYHVTNVTTAKTQTLSFSVRSGDTHEFDLGSVLEKGQNTLVVQAIGSNSGTSELSYTSISCIELALKESTNFNPLVYAYNQDMSFHFIPVGTVKKRLNVYIDDVLEESACKDLLATDNEQSMSVTIPKKDHGVYTLRAELTYNTGVTTIATDPLIYQIAFLEPDNDAPLIWFDRTPEKIVNHDKLNIKYMVYDPVSPDRTSVERYINNAPIAPLDNIAYNNTKWLNWNISNYVIGENTFTLKCGSTSASVTVFVEEDELRDLDILTSDLYLNLVSSGRSNSENETQRQTWVYERSDNTRSAVKFNNFNWYNNGWIDDASTGDSVLRISNGASIEIPVSVMNTDELNSNLTFEIQFKLRNVQKYENLIEITSEEITDDKGEVVQVKVTKKVKSTDGVWCNYYGNEIGMCLGTQEGFFKSSQVIASGRYKEDDIVTISFVAEKAAATNQYPLIYMYINGIMSSIVNYDKNGDTFGNNVQNIVINSDFCDVDLYKIRIYKAALSSADIVHNYIADQNSADLYDMNQIIEFKNNIPTISYAKMRDYNAAHPEAPLQPYAVLECIDKKEDLLPYIKDGKKNVNVTFVNPALDYAYDNKLIDGEAYLMGCPSYEAKNIPFDVQGTSSQGYPRRNYKGKFKKETGEKANSWTYTNGPLKGKEIGEDNDYNGVTYKNYYMDNHYSESTFTWKADYMESSMTHNTGFASFVKTLYSKHPLQDYDSSIDVTDRRTTIYGFPMLLFQKKADGSYEFIGRYNYNLDKGCNNVIGFKEKTKHPVLTDKSIADVAECWELCNNQMGRTAFTVTDFDALTAKGELAVLDDFEYRYHPDSDNIDDALERKKDFANKTQEEINAFLFSKYTNLEKVAKWLKSTYIKEATGAKLVDENGADAPYEHAGKFYFEDTAEYRIAKFAKEFNDWFDLEYCTVYFIMTEMLLQYDSRGKNMMLASWGPKTEGGNYIWYPLFYDIDTQLGVNNSGVPSWDYDTEPSPFYGSGGIFSTPESVLWYNFEQCFMSAVQSTYDELRKNNLTYEKLKGYYDYDPDVSGSYAMMGHRPVNIINVDQYWKYIAPTFTGYIDTSGQTATDNGTRFYCLQGSRQLQRDLFLRNRFNYLDSKWLAGTYSKEGMTHAFMVRANANCYPDTSDKYLDTENLTPEEISAGFEKAPWKQPLDTDVTFKITPYLHQYGTLYFDETLMTGPIKWDGINPINLDLDSNAQQAFKGKRSLQEQIFRIGGGEYISSLGDLSKFYINELNLTQLKRLKDLHFGSDDPGYYNRLAIKTFALNANATNPDGTPNDNAKALLEQVVLTNVQQLTNPVDVTGAEKLREFRALGTGITGVTFANGGQMETIHLPSTVTHLTFIEPVKLKGLITNEAGQKDADGKFVPGLYIPGITTTGALDTKTSINKLNIVGGQMGYSSYQLMKNLIDIKTAMRTDPTVVNDSAKRISIAMEDILWSPYKLVEYGVAKDSQKSYVKKTENSTFVSYTPTDADWAQNTLDALVYEVLPEANAEKDCLTNLDIINTFISSDNLSSASNNYFKDITQYGDGRPTYPYLSGDIFINNPSSAKISEFEIKRIMEDYYPDLNIYVANVDPAYTLKMVEIIENTETGAKQTVELQTVKYDKTSATPIKAEDIKVSPSRLHHDFKGWSLTENGDLLTDVELEALAFSGEKMTYVLYAVFDWENYNAYFYNGDSYVGQTDPVIYGHYFYEIAEVPNREEDEAVLPLTERIAFYGWSDKPQSNPVFDTEESARKVIVNVSEFKATENKAFYAIFVKENVYSKATDNKYFSYEEATVNGIAGYKISSSDNYTLRGKITIPATYNGKPVISLGSFQTALDATGIFFMDGSQLQEVGNYAFSTGRDGIKLAGVYLPDSVTRIGEYAFNDCYTLEHVSEHYAKFGTDGNLPAKLTTIGSRGFGMTSTEGRLHLKTLPASLKECGERAFYNCGSNVYISELPVNIPTIPVFSFSGCPNISITNFGSKQGDAGVSTPLNFIGQLAFSQYTTGANRSINNIYVWDSVKTIDQNAFQGYGARTSGDASAVVLYTNHSEDIGWDAASIGVARIEYNYSDMGGQ